MAKSLTNETNIQEQVNAMKSVMVGFRYRHFKGEIYLVTDLAVHSESNEIMVVYKNFKDSGQVWVRPLDMFLSKVDTDKYPDVKQAFRFERIGEDEYYYSNVLIGMERMNYVIEYIVNHRNDDTTQNE